MVIKFAISWHDYKIFYIYFEQVFPIFKFSLLKEKQICE